MARTVADLAGDTRIDEYAVSEAVRYRVLERQKVN